MPSRRLEHIMPEDRFPNFERAMSGPYTRAVAVTPNDSTDLAFRTRAVIVAADGNLEVHMAGSSTPVVIAVAAGHEYRMRVDRILAANTTATGIVALD